MKNLAIVLASLCVLATATSVFQSPSFIQLKQDPYGFSVASLIELNLKSGQNTGALDAVAEILNTLSSDLASSVANNNLIITQQRAWCNDQQSTVSGNLASAQADLETYSEEQAQLIAQQETNQGNLDSESADLHVNEESQSKAVIALAEENARNEAAVSDFADSIAACQEALQLLSTLQVSPATFIQSKARLGNVVALLSKRLQNKTSPLVQPILNVLAELSTESKEVNQEKLGKIIDLIKELLGELSNQQSQNTLRHEEAVAQLQETIGNLDTLIGNSNVSIDNYQGALDQIAQRLNQVNSLLAQVDALVSSFTDELASNQATCDGYEVAYVEISTHIQGQVQVLEKVKEYFLNNVVPSVEEVSDTNYQDNLTVDVV